MKNQFHFALCLIILMLFPGCFYKPSKPLTLPQPRIARPIPKISQAESQEVDADTVKKAQHDNERKVLRGNIKEMPLAELRERLKIDLERSYQEDALQVIKQILLISTDQEELRELRLELADIYFDLGKMKEAGRLYREYVKLYPGSAEKDYAEYKKILCNFYAQIKPPRDQTRTSKTVDMTISYLNQSPEGQAFREDVQKIQKVCHQDIFEHEKGIFLFYCKQNSLTAAQTRLANIKKHFASTHLFDPECIELEAYLAQLQGNTELVMQKQLDIETKFPLYNPRLLTSLTTPRNSNVTRF